MIYHSLFLWKAVGGLSYKAQPAHTLKGQTTDPFRSDEGQHWVEINGRRTQLLWVSWGQAAQCRHKDVLLGTAQRPRTLAFPHSHFKNTISLFPSPN